MLRRSSRSDLIVPIHDRRKDVRVLTLRNFGLALLVAVVVFAGLEAASHLRAPQSGDFGRLYQRHIGAHPVEASRAPEVVSEAPVPDQTAADPLLVSGAVRSRYLETTAIAPVSASGALPCPAGDSRCSADGETFGSLSSTQDPARAGHLRSGGVAIVGDAHGVSIATPAKDAGPKLSGGIFRRSDDAQPVAVAPDPAHS